jgi:CheY-like chemotaxis protein
MGQSLHRLISEEIELRTILDPHPGYIKADPGQLEQVILNLVINARDAMPHGGLITLETATVELDEAYARQNMGVIPGPYVLLAISDTGEGMDETTQAHIFEPFFTTKEVGQGTGLGLATVHGIVNQSGGHIWVYSEPGRGTIFKVYLPRVQLEPAASAKQLKSGGAAGGSETVLLVEDEAEVRNLAREVLQRQGYLVLEAGDGPAAIELCKKHPGSIDVLLTDVIMPKGFSGLELAQYLGPAYPAMKVLFMSGYTDNALAHHEGLKPGAAFLEKPFTPETLARKLRQVLDGE